MYVRMYVRMYVCIYVWVYVYIDWCIFTHGCLLAGVVAYAYSCYTGSRLRAVGTLNKFTVLSMAHVKAGAAEFLYVS